jgi:rod shape-determining protein MreC
MAVVNQAGLVGKVTHATDYTAHVMLVTDARYTVAVKVTSGAEGEVETPTNTTPSGLTPEQVEAEGTTTTTTTIAPVTTGPNGLPLSGSELPGAPLLNPDTGEAWTQADLDYFAQVEAEQAAADAEAQAGDTEPETTEPETTETSEPALSTTTTTTIAPIIEKEYGGLEGRGRRRLPQVRFLQDTPSLSELQVGDLVETAGGSTSLAPTGIPVGRVINRADRPGSGGPLLDVELYADLGRLNFVRVVLYKPLSEVEQ